jgi:hypothetical protein
VTTLADLAGRASFDPLVRSALLAAALLALASLAASVARRDLSALTRPAGGVALAAALLAASGLSAATAAATRLAGDLGALGAGAERLPLYLLAIGYGPGVGLVGAVAWSAATPRPWLAEVGQARLALEALLVGWAALAPSPRRRRWAAPVAVALGWALATATLGLAAWATDARATSWGAFWGAQREAFGVLALTSLVAALPPPRWWRRVPGAAPALTGRGLHEGVRWLRPLAAPRRPRRAGRPHPRWPTPTPPAPLRRARRRRSRIAPFPVPQPLRRPDAEASLRRR